MGASDVKTFKAVGLAANDTSGVVERMVFERREPQEHDVLIEVEFCGICHSDVHQIRGEWDQTVRYPMVPGHEIVGRVAKVGAKVTTHKVGDRVGVGCFVDSCRNCDGCKKGEESYCRGVPGKKDGMHGTYNSCLRDPENIRIRNCSDGEILFGGYSSHITVDEKYTLRIPESIPPETAAPLLCAGITTYSPLMFFGKLARVSCDVPTGPLCVGVVGFGGLGHMAVQIGKALGHTVSVISRSERKADMAKQLGADNFIISTDKNSMKQHSNTMHLIIDTVSADHDISPLLGDLLVTSGILCLVGLPANPVPVKPFQVVGKRKIFAGSLIGGIRETQEMLDFCAQHQLHPHVELIDAKQVNQKLHALAQNANTANRYVIKVKETLAPALKDEAWQTNEEPAIDPSTWKVHPNAVVVPEQANIHRTLAAPKASAHIGKSSCCASSPSSPSSCSACPVLAYAHCIAGSLAIAALAVALFKLSSRK